MANKTDKSTKEMLDELDELMEKMLALPVHQVDDAPAFPKEVVKSPAMSATLTLLESSPEPIAQSESLPVNPPHRVAPVPPPPELEPTAADAHPVLNPPHLTMQREQDPAVTLSLEPLSNQVLPPTVSEQIEPLLARVPEAPAPSIATPGIGPLLWVNLTFDGATRYLGVGGDWLRGQMGRNLLGFAGIALMAVAIGWFLKDWLGWQ